MRSRWQMKRVNVARSRRVGGGVVDDVVVRVDALRGLVVQVYAKVESVYSMIAGLRSLAENGPPSRISRLRNGTSSCDSIKGLPGWGADDYVEAKLCEPIRQVSLNLHSRKSF